MSEHKLPVWSIRTRAHGLTAARARTRPFLSRAGRSFRPYIADRATGGPTASGGVFDPVVAFFGSYIWPYLPSLVILLIVVAFASWMSSRSRAGGQKRALADELTINLGVGNEILSFVDSQTVGEWYATPIPRFRTSAFEEVSRSGNLHSLKKHTREDLLAIYSAIELLDAASDRQ